jgi:hypothetical protein
MPSRLSAKEIVMSRGFLPFYFYSSPTATRLLRENANRVAVLALRAILQQRKSLEVAHQQIHFGGQDYAFSSRIADGGLLVIELDIGDPRLAHHLILEEDLRKADRKAKGIREEGRRSR